MVREEDVQAEVIGLHKQLLGSIANRLPSSRDDIMQQGSMLNRQQLQLVAPITREEVLATITNIDDYKKPGSDGYNALFYKKILGHQRREYSRGCSGVL